jgi:hypothetical protein
MRLVVLAVVGAIGLARYGCQVPTIGRLVGCADEGDAVVLGVGNNRRMRGNKNLKRVFYQSAFASLRSSPESRAFYDRKRAEGKRHI